MDPQLNLYSRNAWIAKFGGLSFKRDVLDRLPNFNIELDLT